MLIVLKKTWMHNVNTALGGGVGKMCHFHVGLNRKVVTCINLSVYHSPKIICEILFDDIVRCVIFLQKLMPKFNKIAFFLSPHSSSSSKALKR